MFRVIGFLSLACWLCLSAVIGVQGIVLLEMTERQNQAKNGLKLEDPIIIDEIYFLTNEEAIVYAEIQSLSDFFFIKALSQYPTFLLLILTSCAFGILGCCVAMIKSAVLDKERVSNVHMGLLPLLGLMVGIIVLAIADLVPVLFTEGSGTIRPITLVFLSFFGGLFIKQFYPWLERRFKEQLAKKVSQ